MKKLKRIVKFTVETERTLIFKSRGYRRVGWCERCGAELEMPTVDDAARGCVRLPTTWGRKAKTTSTA